MTTMIFGNSCANVLRANGQGSVGVVSLSGITYPVIFTQAAIQKREKVQVVESFNETIYLYAFGGAADSASVSGYVLANSVNPGFQQVNALLIDKYSSTLRAFQAAKKGAPVSLGLPGGIVFSGVCVSMDINVSAEIPSILSFSLSMIAVDIVSGKSNTANSTKTSTSQNANQTSGQNSSTYVGQTYSSSEIGNINVYVNNPSIYSVNGISARLL